MMLFDDRKQYGKQYCTILPAVLMGGGALASIGGSIFGGIMGNKGAKKQAETTAKWTNSALNDLSNAWSATAETTQPFRRLGEDSADVLGNLLMGGDVRGALQASPLYQFQQEQGSRALNRELASRGLHGSGAGIETLARFNAQLQGEEGERLFSRLFGATQLGANMANAQAGLYANIAGQRAQTKLGAGQAIGGAQNQQYQSLANMGMNIGQDLAGAAGGISNFMMYKPIMDAQARMFTQTQPMAMPGGGGGGLSQFGPYASNYRGPSSPFSLTSG